MTDGATGTPCASAKLRAEILSPISAMVSRIRPDEGEPGLGDRSREAGILGQEAVARMDRVGAGRQRRLDDLLAVEMRRDRRVAENLDRLVGHADMPGAGLDAVMDGDRRDAELAQRADRPGRRSRRDWRSGSCGTGWPCPVARSRRRRHASSSRAILRASASRPAVRRPAASAPGTSTGRSIRIWAIALPCGSWRSEAMPPPPRPSCSRKLKPSRPGHSNRSTLPLAKCAR